VIPAASEAYPVANAVQTALHADGAVAFSGVPSFAVIAVPAMDL